MRIREGYSILFVFLILLVPAASSSVSINPENLSANPGKPAYFSLDFSEVEGNFSVKLQGPGQITVNPSNFSLDDGNNMSVNVWFRPYNEIEGGTYELEGEVFRDGEVFERLSPSVEVSNMHRLVLSSIEQPGCSDDRVSVIVENRGMASEEVRLFFGDREVGRRSLRAGEKLNFTLETGTSGLLEIVSRDSYAYDSIRIEDSDCRESRLLGSFIGDSGGWKVSIAVIFLALIALISYRITRNPKR